MVYHSFRMLAIFGKYSMFSYDWYISLDFIWPLPISKAGSSIFVNICAKTKICETEFENLILMSL